MVFLFVTAVEELWYVSLALYSQFYDANTEFLNRILLRTWLSKCNLRLSLKSFAQALVSNWPLLFLSFLTGCRREVRFDSS